MEQLRGALQGDQVWRQSPQKEDRSRRGKLTGSKKKQNIAPAGNMLSKSTLTIISQAIMENTF